MNEASWEIWWLVNRGSLLPDRGSVRGRATEAAPVTGVGAAGVDAQDGRGRSRDVAASTQAVPFLEQVADPASGMRPDVIASALLALGRSARDGSAVPLLVRWIDDTQAPDLVRESAALAAGLLRRSRADLQLDGQRLDLLRERLLALFDQDWAPYRARCFAALSLGLLADQPYGHRLTQDGARVIGALRQRAGGSYPTWDLNVCVITALGMQPPEGVPEGLRRDLREIVQGKRTMGRRWTDCERSHAVTAAARIGGAGIDRFLLHVLADKRQGAMVRRAAWIAVGSRAARMDRDDLAAAVTALVKQAPREREPLTGGLALVALGRLAGAALREAPADAESAARALDHLRAEFQAGRAATAGFGALALGLACRPADGLSTDAERLRVEVERDLLAALADNGDPTTRGAVAVALGLMEAPRSVTALRSLLEDDGAPEALRGHAAVALGQVGRATSDVTIALQKALLGGRGDVLRGQAALGLSLLATPSATNHLVRELRTGKTEHLLAEVTVALGRLDDLDAVGPLLEVARDRSRSELTQALAVVSLGMLVDPEGRPSLQRLAADANYPARTDALQELFSIL